MGPAKGRMQDGDEKVAENVFSVPFHGVDRSACPDARIGDLPSVWRRVPILIYLWDGSFIPCNFFGKIQKKY